MFFHFNLLCQKLAYFCFANTTAVFLPFLYCFLPLCPFPLLLGHFALCPLEVYSFFYSMLFHSLSFWGSLRFSQCLFVSTAIFLPFLYCFLPFAPFPLLLGHFARCHLKFCPLFSYSLLFHSLSFGAVFALLQCLCVSTVVSLPFCVLPFAPLPFFLCFWAFRPLPFSILQTAFCPLPFTSPFCCFLSFLCVGFTFCVTFDGNLLQKFVTRQKV